MSSVSKGNTLEDAFYEYLINQQIKGDLVFGAHPPQLCQIHKKKKYYSSNRKSSIEFDIVIELYKDGRDIPYLYIIFECKNHKGSIRDAYVREFSSKLDEMFPHGSKGVIVITSRLQSGAEEFAKSKKIGVLKYNPHGIEIIADRKDTYFEQDFVKSQIFVKDNFVKSLKFSALYDGKYFSSCRIFFSELINEYGNNTAQSEITSVKFISEKDLKQLADKALEYIGYKTGPVNLEEICKHLLINVEFTNSDIINDEGFPILGTANFDRKIIQINLHKNKFRERFTIAHEIGHFFLNHELYLSSENIIEQDLFLIDRIYSNFNYDRLEFQANYFAANLILPDSALIGMTEKFRSQLGMHSKIYDAIFVDNQPCNIHDYYIIMMHLSEYFNVSRKVIEIKLKKLGLLIDRREKKKTSSGLKNIFDIIRK